MSTNDKQYLLERLTETHAALKNLLDGADLELEVYADTGWRIRDLLGHIATWDWEMVTTLQAFQAGNEYIIPGIEVDESDYNANDIAKQQTLSTEQILANWKKARVDLLAAIEAIPTDLFPGDFVFPWGDERGTIVQLLDYFIEHDEEHHAEFVPVLKK